MTQSDGHAAPLARKNRRLRAHNRRLTATLRNREGCGGRSASLLLPEGLPRDETLFESFFTNAPTGMMIMRLDLEFIQVNAAFCQLTGYTCRELLGKRYPEITHPDFVDNDIRQVSRLLGGEVDAFQVEKKCLDKRGGEVWVLLSMALIRGNDGAPCYYIGQTQDITERRRMEEKLRKNELMTRTILDNIMAGIVQCDRNGLIEGVNPAASRMFGYLEEEIIGTPFTNLLLEDFRSRYADSFSRQMESGDRRMIGRELEVLGNRRDGSVFPARIAINGMAVDGETFFVGVISDLTEEKRLQKELIHSEKMASLGDLVAGVAHEINTPVGIGVTAASEFQEKSLAFTNLLETEGISEEELHTFLRSARHLAALIHDNLLRAGELVRSFKSVAVDQASEEIRTFRVQECIASAVLSLQHQLKRTRILVDVDCPEQLTIRHDPGALSRIILNLVSNSMIHAFQPGEAGRITIRVVQSEEWLVLTYQDDGHGMSQEQYRRIFEPFFTTKREHGGSGLGMHIVYNLVTQSLGGTISGDSAPGKGARFLIRFPLSEPDPMHKRVAS